MTLAQFLKCHIYIIWFGLFSAFACVVPVLRRTFPESSYTVTCLPLQTVTESCWCDNTHPVTLISISIFTFHGQNFVEVFSIYSTEKYHFKTIPLSTPHLPW